MMCEPGVMLCETPDTINVCVSVLGVPTTKFLITVQMLVMSRFKQMFWLAVESADICVDKPVKRKTGF